MPLGSTFWPYFALVSVSVLIQEVFRFLLWRFHRFSLRLLSRIAGEQQHTSVALTVSDHFALSFTHGLAHGTIFGVLFCIVWLPLYLGDGTLYLDACPHMSYFLICALYALSFAIMLAGAMVIGFDGMERGDRRQGLIAPASIHLSASLSTLINLAQDGCLISIPFSLVSAGVVATWAMSIWWRRTGVAFRQGNPSRQLYSTIHPSEE